MTTPPPSTHAQRALYMRPMPGDETGRLFGQTIRAARKERKMSQELLGEAVGVSRQTIREWETKPFVVPSVVHLTKLARVLRIRFAELKKLVARTPGVDRGMRVPMQTYRMMVKDYLQSELASEIPPAVRQELFRSQSRAYARQYIHSIRLGIEERAATKRR